MRRAASAAGRVDAKLTGVLQGAEDRVLAPRASARLRGCTVACVRQHIPPAARATFGPGLRLPARAHPTERAVAVLQWPETVATAVQYAWPDHPDWPARGRVDWKLDLVLDGHPVRVAERVPQFAAARLFAPGPTARVGTPVLVLRSPAGELAVDWEATLNDG